jgi:hypothetical protein
MRGDQQRRYRFVMTTVIAILVLALTTSLSQAAPTKQRHKAKAEISRDARKEVPQRNRRRCPALILGIAY